MFFSLGLQSNTFNCKRSRLAKTVVEKHSTVVAKMNQSSSVDLENSCDHLFFSWSSTVSFCRFNTRSSHRSSCFQLYRLSVYLLFERDIYRFIFDIYFGRENETKSSNSLQRLLASLALTDLLTGLVVQPLHGAMTIFLLQRISFLEFCGINLGFSISFVVIWHAVLGHKVISGERYLSIKYAFAHKEMLTKTRVIVLSVWRLDPKHSWLLFSVQGNGDPKHSFESNIV